MYTEHQKIIQAENKWPRKMFYSLESTETKETMRQKKTFAL